MTLSSPKTCNATIFALSSGQGGAIAIIRASGDGAGDILAKLCQGRTPAPRRASLRRLYHAQQCLDEAMVIWFPGPSSYTGEPSFELHVHAGVAVVQAVSDALVQCGARPAEAGEFTRRAVQNGRMDLLQAEAVADLIAAESALQREQALAQVGGALTRVYDDWRTRLSHLLAKQEAQIDFPEDLDEDEAATVMDAEIAQLKSELKHHLQDDHGEIVQRGMTIVIAGSPNVGKSSLLNRLVGYDAAIVTARAGTTRDVIAVDWVFDGMKIKLIDTAGLRDTDDEIEAEGIRRALFHVKHADIVLHLFSECLPNNLEKGEVLVHTKSDLTSGPKGVLSISTTTGGGLDQLKAFLSQRVADLRPRYDSAPLTRARHRAGVEEAHAHLTDAEVTPFAELKGESLRLAMRALGRLTGQFDVESLLDVIFGQFCIGK